VYITHNEKLKINMREDPNIVRGL